MHSGAMQATFSLAAVDPGRELAGAVTASRYIAVGALTIHADVDAGVVITQSVADRAHASQALPLLASGDDPAAILSDVLAADSSPALRQIGILRRDGERALYSGDDCTPVVAEAETPQAIALGNMLANETVPQAMCRAYTDAYRTAVSETEHAASVSDRRDDVARFAAALLAGLAAGESAGGDRRGKQAAAIVVVGRGAGYGGRDDRAVDLRVDDHSDPVGELQRLFKLFLDNQRREFGE